MKKLQLSFIYLFKFIYNFLSPSCTYRMRAQWEQELFENLVESTTVKAFMQKFLHVGRQRFAPSTPILFFIFWNFQFLFIILSFVYKIRVIRSSQFSFSILFFHFLLVPTIVPNVGKIWKNWFCFSSAGTDSTHFFLFLPLKVEYLIFWIVNHCRV